MKDFFSRFIAIIDCLPLQTFKERDPAKTSIASDIFQFVLYWLKIPFKAIEAVFETIFKILKFIKNIRAYLKKVVDIYELLKKKTKNFSDY